GLDHQRVAAEFDDADAERDPGPGGLLVEQDRDRARPFQRPEPEPVDLHPVGQVEHLELLSRGQVVVATEMTDSHFTAPSRIPGSAPMNSCACSAVSTSGGANRIALGATALTRNPAARAAASTGPDASRVSSSRSHRPAPDTEVSN